MVEIREERPSDQAAIHRLNTIAFRDDAEANIVDELRATCDGFLSYVAIEHGAVVGHILFTPVTLDGSSRDGMGLAPMAVDPSRQRRGIGSLLVRHGLAHLRGSGCPFVIVLGHPDYYPRFGFERASRYNISSQWEGVPDEAFMIVVFEREAIPAAGGIARYRSEFDAAM
jgi:putative acetyltransferase